jgi:tetratricopeptide (TPR) repeat protein
MQPGRPQGGGTPKLAQIEQVGMPRLFFALLHQRFTGTLSLEQPSPEGVRTVWLAGGMPLFTDWLSPNDVLGQVLVELRAISEDELTEALGLMATQGGLLGAILKQRGTLDDTALAEGLRRQCLRKLVGTFALRSGEVTVVSGEFVGADALGRVNVLELVLAGVSASYDEARIEGELGAAYRGPVIATQALPKYRPHFRFRNTDEPVVDALAIGGTIADIAARSGVSTKRVAQLAYVLWACQMLRVGASVSDPASAPPRRPTPAPPPSALVPTPVPAPTPARRPTPARTPTPVPAAPEPTVAAASTEPTAAEFAAELVEFERKLAASVDAFELLGVSLDAGKREARRAFSDLSRRFHPDSLAARNLGHLRERVSKVFAALSEAQMVLSDPDQRELLKQSIERGDKPGSGDDPAAIARAAFESEMIAKDADKLLRAARFDRALEHYQRALALTPNEHDIVAAVSWCEYNMSPRDRAAAELADAKLAAVLAEAPNIARAHYFRGLVLKDLGLIDAAIGALTRAVEIDPRMIDAERHARALKAQRQAQAAKPDKERGPFGIRGIFGKR